MLLLPGTLYAILLLIICDLVLVFKLNAHGRQQVVASADAELRPLAEAEERHGGVEPHAHDAVQVHARDDQRLVVVRQLHALLEAPDIHKPKIS